MVTLSPGQALLLKGLKAKPRLASKLGPLQAVMLQLVDRKLAERYAPGDSPAKTMVRITPAGLAALTPPKD